MNKSRLHSLFWVIIVTSIVIFAILLFFLFASGETESVTELVTKRDHESPQNLAGPSTSDLETMHGEEEFAPQEEEVAGNVWEVCGIADWPASTGHKGAEEFIDSLEKNDTFLTKRALDVVEKLFLDTWEPSRRCLVLLESYMQELEWYRPPKDEYRFAKRKIENPITTTDIFHDPKGDLELVLEALSRPECRVEDGVVADRSLKEHCHGEAFANYAMFYRLCTATASESWDGSLRRAWIEFEISRPESNENRIKSVYIREVPYDWYLTRRWIKEKCEEYDSGTILTVDQYPLPLGDSSFVYWTRFDDILGEGYARDGDDRILGLNELKLFSSLLRTARRLGVVGYTDPTPYPSPAWEVRSEMKLARTRIEKLSLSILYIEKLKESDEVAVDWERLVDYICSDETYWRYTDLGMRIPDPKNPRQPTCQSLIQSMLDTTDPTTPSGSEIQNILVKFEQVAIELNVYN